MWRLLSNNKAMSTTATATIAPVTRYMRLKDIVPEACVGCVEDGEEEIGVGEDEAGKGVGVAEVERGSN